jgi:hypothetical protein
LKLRVFNVAPLVFVQAVAPEKSGSGFKRNVKVDCHLGKPGQRATGIEAMSAPRPH